MAIESGRAPEKFSAVSGERASLRVSVVVPVRNEEQSLQTLITSLLRQTFPPSEVIIVDGGSDDDTASLARHLTKGDERFRIVEAGNATPGRGRNVGIIAARHDWIALTDAGIRVEPTWLERLVQVIETDPGVAIVYGNYEPVTESFFESCAALSYPAPKSRRAEGWIRAPFIASSLLRRDVWQSIGGFPDLRAAEDLIFMEQIEKRGFKIGWAPTATVWWQLQPSLRRTFRKFVVYSRHNVWANRQRYWHYGIARQYAIALLFIALALLHSAWWGIVLVIGLAARVLKSIWRRRENRGLLWTLNPLRFFGVAVILLCIDLATFVGWAQALWQRSAPATRVASTTKTTSPTAASNETES